MREKRRFRRVNYLGTGWLYHNEARHFCRLENLSINGALVRLKKAPVDPICHGDKCRLVIYQDAEGQQTGQFAARIARYESALAGLEFIEEEAASQGLLENIISKEKHLSDGAEKIMALARELAELSGFKMNDLHFDQGELNPEREIHTLRCIAGEHCANVHLNRADIEGLCLPDGAGPARAKIQVAVRRLDGLLKG